MKSLKERVVLITGASSGIGYETALAFAREGCRIAAVARRRDRLKDLAGEITRLGSECFPQPVDVSNRDEVSEAGRQVIERWGRLDIAVANAGYGYLARVEQIDPLEMNRIWEVNFLGTLWTIQAALPQMKKQQEGHIVIVSSVVGRYSLPLSSAYCVTKFSQAALAQSLRPEIKKHNIGVTVVYPGYTATEFGEKQLHQERRKKVPRKGQPAREVAADIVSAVRRNRKEIYPSFTGSLFAHLGLWFPFLADQVTSYMESKMDSNRQDANAPRK